MPATIDVERSKGKIIVDDITYTATVRVRHSTPTCKETKHDVASCTCRKSIMTYNGKTRKQRIISAKTRSWANAEKFAEKWLDQFDPKAVEEAKRVTIENAVRAYLDDVITRLGEGGTAERNQTLLGYINHDGTVRRKGRLQLWLDTLRERPVFISDITPDHVRRFRDSWDFNSDLTTASSFGTMKTFFKFCHAMGWIPSNPTTALRRPQTKRGNRTATFTDEEYARILDAAHGNQRLETFLELLRWSGMALVDATTFKGNLIDREGVLRYKRAKTSTIATVKLPDHVLALLRDVPLESYNTPDQPFLRQGVDLETCEQDWRKALQALFVQAGVETVKTDVRERPAHPHMLRDTCAVWYLRHGMSLYGVSKVLGHTNPTITARAYLPFVKELEKAHIAENESVLAAAQPKQQGSKVLRITRK
jgi:integrase